MAQIYYKNLFLGKYYNGEKKVSYFAMSLDIQFIAASLDPNLESNHRSILADIYILGIWFRNKMSWINYLLWNENCILHMSICWNILIV